MVLDYEVPEVRTEKNKVIQNAIHVSILRVMTLQILMGDKSFEQSKIQARLTKWNVPPVQLSEKVMKQIIQTGVSPFEDE